MRHKVLQTALDPIQLISHNQVMKAIRWQHLKIRLSLVFTLCFLGAVSICAVASERDLITYSVSQADRPEYDTKRDAARKPENVLRFFGVRPGMTVIDIFSGGGYYTELLSYAVGEKGKVIAHNNQAYINYVEKRLKQRFAKHRLTNVERLVSEANKLDVSVNSVDLAVMVLAYHDIYYNPKNKSWPTIDRDDFLQRVYVMLKPGGTLGIIDHQAAPGSPAETGNTLHRIDPALVIHEVSAVGFKLVDEADFLKNASDDLTKHMYAPDLRGKTSRFVLKFIKPLNVEQPLARNDIPLP